jgi:hypothetical protein
MTIEQIVLILDCDITSPKRDMHLNYLRALVATDLRKNQHTFQSIATSLNRTPATIMSLVKQLDYYKKDPLFKYVEKAYKKSDIREIENYFKYQRLRRLDYNKLHHEKTYKRQPKVEKEKCKSLDFQRPDILEVAFNLRNINTPLNNKQYNKWSYNDFVEYKKLINETSTK